MVNLMVCGLKKSREFPIPDDFLNGSVQVFRKSGISSLKLWYHFELERNALAQRVNIVNANFCTNWSDPSTNLTGLPFLVICHLLLFLFSHVT